jgi:zinc protease
MTPGIRSVAPPLREIESITLPAIHQLQLSNGIPVYSISAENQEVIRVELLFDAGRWQEPQKAVAATTSKMLLEGSTHKSAQQLAEEIDFYGATISTEATIDYGLVTLFTLNKHADKLFPLLHEVIYDATFPEKELSTYVQNSKQRLMVNLQKVDFLAHKAFNEALYGSFYPMGYTTTGADYDSINPELLHHFYGSQYKSGSCKIIVAGKVTDHLLFLLDECFGKDVRNNSVDSMFNNREISHSAERKIFVEKKDAVQSGIRIGKTLVNKLHPDYTPLKLLNTIFGGYFGSRLMQNLREDKGYCYGVHSSVSSYLHSANLSITTEVGGGVTWDAVKEIYNEVDRLRSEIIPEEELKLVKNYLLGVFLSDVDGPFNAADILRSLIVYGLNEQFFYGMVEKIKTTSAEQLRELAEKYFDPETMTEVVSGNPEIALSGKKTVMAGMDPDRP